MTNSTAAWMCIEGEGRDQTLLYIVRGQYRAAVYLSCRGNGSRGMALYE